MLPNMENIATRRYIICSKYTTTLFFFQHQQRNRLAAIKASLTVVVTIAARILVSTE